MSTQDQDAQSVLTILVPTLPPLHSQQPPATLAEREAAFQRLKTAHENCRAVRVEIRSAHYSLRNASAMHTKAFNEYIAALEAWELTIVPTAPAPGDFT
jgi:hypothetical protein